MNLKIMSKSSLAALLIALAGVALAQEASAPAPALAATSGTGSASAPATTTEQSYNPTLSTPISAAGAPTYSVPTEPVIVAKQAPSAAPVTAKPAPRVEPALAPGVEGAAPVPKAVAAKAPAAEVVKDYLPNISAESAPALAPYAAKPSTTGATVAPAQAPLPYAAPSKASAPAPASGIAAGALAPKADAIAEGISAALGGAPGPGPLVAEIRAALAPLAEFAPALAPTAAKPLAATPALAPMASAYGMAMSAPAPAPVRAYGVAASAPAPGPEGIVAERASVASKGAPAPAPTGLMREAASSVPLIRPVEFAPAQAPVAPAACASTPFCQLFVEDMLCCASEGIVTSASHALVWALCTNPVDLSDDVLQVEGPANVTTFGVFNGPGKQYNYRFIVDWSNQPGYDGIISIRANPRSVLSIAPCVDDAGTVVAASPLPKPLTFRVRDRADFVDSYIACPADTALDALDSWTWQEQNAALTTPTTNNGACYQQNTGALGPEFFRGGWAKYAGGYQSACNATANFETLERLGVTMAPAPGPALPSALRTINPTGQVAYAG